MKKYLILLLLVLAFVACEDEQTNSYGPIKLGKEKTSIKTITLNKFTERKILLSGGNEKFSVAIEDSRIAKATIYRDTLTIKALLEGKTVALIKSHNQEISLGVHVVPQEIKISENSIRLYPKSVSTFVSVNGGGDIVEMEEIDPESILDARWNGETGILKLKAHYEGNAVIRFRSNNIVSKELKIEVRSDGSPTEIGIYSTINKIIYKRLVPLMITKRKGVGTWLSVSTSPYGLSGGLRPKVAVKFDPIKNPIQGEKIDIKASFFPNLGGVSNIRNGLNTVYVEKINTTQKTVVLRGRGFRLILPYE